MKNARLSGQRISVEDFNSFRELLDELDATFSGKERRFAEKGIEVYDCEVSFDENCRIMTREERATFDLGQHWKKILDFCKERGFQQV